ncbi:hypothetical protein [Helicobacter bilis]|uniref:hypothetical protein n=1 Tax=Helicobacter bilis TaxID=37372 RepID=UPI0025583227|nr:hypothetical protein [Helicobacter bilis]
MRIALLSSLFMFSVLYAKCDCLCVNGNVEAICSNAYEVRPVCNPRVCPIVPPPKHRAITDSKTRTFRHYFMLSSTSV